MEPVLTITIRLKGKREQIESIRSILLPDFTSTVLSEKIEGKGNEAIWIIDLTAKTISRLRAITNSILKAISLTLEIENILENYHE